MDAGNECDGPGHRIRWSGPFAASGRLLDRDGGAVAHRAAPQRTALVLGQAAPHAVLLPRVERPLETRGADRAAVAHLFGLIDLVDGRSAASDRGRTARIRLEAGGPGAPIGAGGGLRQHGSDCSLLSRRETRHSRLKFRRVGNPPRACGIPTPRRCCMRHEEDRVPVLRPLDAVAALADALGRPTRCCSPSSSRWPPRSSAPTARTSGCTTSRDQLSSPFPLLAAIGARTSRIEIGTGVIDMRYENPLYMAEDAGAADLISGGRLQLGISRGSPEQVIDGFRYFGYEPAEGSDHAAMAREHTRVFLEVIKGEGFAEPNPRPMFPNPPGLLRIEPHSPGLRDRIWWGAGTRETAEWTARAGHEPDELDAAHRGHRGAVPPAPGRADPAVPGRLDGRRARARAAGLGQPQHLPDRQRPGPGVLRPRDRQPGPGRVPRRRHGPVRQDVRRGARRSW